MGTYVGKRVTFLYFTFEHSCNKWHLKFNSNFWETSKKGIPKILLFLSGGWKPHPHHILQRDWHWDTYSSHLSFMTSSALRLRFPSLSDNFFLTNWESPTEVINLMQTLGNINDQDSSSLIVPDTKVLVSKIPRFPEIPSRFVFVLAFWGSELVDLI